MSNNTPVLFIDGWDVLSRYGIGREVFRRSLTENACLERCENTSRVPGFDLKAQLGTKGTRAMDRLSGLSVLATGLALGNSGSLSGQRDSKQVGLVLGTSTGSIKSITDFTRDTFLQQRPILVNPAHFPNTVLNCAAGQCGIWHQLQGPNVTISAGHASFYAALRYAARALMGGYATSLVVGAVEEVSEQTISAYRQLGTAGQPLQSPLAEGAGMFVARTAEGSREPQRPASASQPSTTIAAVDMGHAAPGELGARLTTCIEQCLEKSRLHPNEISVLVTREPRCPELAAMDREGVAAGLAGHRPLRTLAIEPSVGETYSASGALQLAALLASLEYEPPPAQALATMVGCNGTVAAMVVKKGKAS